VSTGTWQAPAEGISLDPYDTVAAVLSCVAAAPSLRGGLVSAVQLGGDTDTVAALAGGLLGATLTVGQVHGELPWYQAVVLPEPQSAMSEIAASLAMVRAVRSA
jgi:ADP-ribosylglycohydrolase